MNKPNVLPISDKGEIVLPFGLLLHVRAPNASNTFPKNRYKERLQKKGSWIGMPKSGTPPPLNLGSPRTGRTAESGQPLSPSTLSPGSPRSLYSAHGSPLIEKPTVRPVNDAEILADAQPQSSEAPPDPASPITAIPQYPPSPPKSSPKHGRDASKSFFSNLMASKSSHRLHSPERNGIHIERQTNSRASSKERNPYMTSKGRGSTPDLPRAGQRRHGKHQTIIVRDRKLM